MENKAFKARKKFGEFKTFGEYLKEGMDQKGISTVSLEDKLAQRKNPHSEKEIKLWLKEARYPDITTIYMLAEIFEIHPNDLLEAKQNMQEAGLNAVDMLTMRVVCNFLDISIWRIHQFNNVMFWVLLYLTAAAAWGVEVPIISPILSGILGMFAGL